MKVLVAAGHSGTDPGAVAGRHTEAALMLELRDAVAARLRAMGVDVAEDGADGQNLPLRAAIELLRGKDLGVELHTNAASAPTAGGVEVVARKDRRAEAQRVAAAIAGVLRLPLRRDKGWFSTDDFMLARRFRPGFAEAGGLIVEVFFISNPAELAKYLALKAQVADAIAEAIAGEGAL